MIAADAEKDLAKAMPALDAAVDALEKLDKKSIAEVKAYAKPPELVLKTMNAVMTVTATPCNPLPVDMNGGWPVFCLGGIISTWTNRA